MERECMEFDVVIVGAGPAGLSAACRIMQLAEEQNQSLSVCVVEKGAEVGVHILSGAIFEHKALDELFPDWERLNAPLHTAVSEDHFCLLTNQSNYLNVAENLTPKPMLNDGNFVISLANFCRWLAQQAEKAGVEIFPGFAAADILYDKQGAVAGIVTSDMGLDKHGEKKATFEPGIELKSQIYHFCRRSPRPFGQATDQQFSVKLRQTASALCAGHKRAVGSPAGASSAGSGYPRCRLATKPV